VVMVMQQWNRRAPARVASKCSKYHTCDCSQLLVAGSGVFALPQARRCQRTGPPAHT
jgi:hypothetical protein